MKLKRFHQVNEDINDDDFSSVMGRHFAGDDDRSSLSTEAELKKYKDCIKDIEYTLTHIKKEPYDYGEGADDAISEVMDLIARVKSGY